ncbi:hypothetical protein BACCAP_01002 [Pseudoflavonifractor capillosus ATCC 29799]|uniref:Uncharacterized protein n=1 Tax=Pseudoflavonifractor capillosus ATCC 29799 TaxID=411467 RepID=A6NS23_9FIRM|nr:hypothetical protein BACCAP_01002 [Pseudoflavonifractor capillosus ATCC 29799]
MNDLNCHTINLLLIAPPGRRRSGGASPLKFLHCERG